MQNIAHERVILFTHAKSDLIKDDFKWQSRYEKIKNMDNIKTHIYHWPALSLEPVLSDDEIASDCDINKNIDFKNICIFTSPMSINLLMNLISDDFKLWLKNQIIYVPGIGSAERLMEFGIKSRIGSSADIEGVSKQINTDFAKTNNKDGFNLFLFRGESSNSNFDIKESLCDFNLKEIVFYKQIENHSSFPEDWVKNIVKQSGESRVKNYIILTSYNGVKAFLKEFKLEFGRGGKKLNSADDLEIYSIMLNELNISVMNDKSINILKEYGVKKINLLKFRNTIGEGLDKDLLDFVKIV
jgi:uroporphyrinogen-III synthase